MQSPGSHGRVCQTQKQAQVRLRLDRISDRMWLPWLSTPWCCDAHQDADAETFCWLCIATGKLSDIRTSSGMFYGRGENAVVKAIEVCMCLICTVPEGPNRWQALGRNKAGLPTQGLACVTAIMVWNST
jgi:hypothetical protein